MCETRDARTGSSTAGCSALRLVSPRLPAQLLRGNVPVA